MTKQNGSIWAIALLLLSLLGVWLASASTANAGEWMQVTCTQPDGQPAPVEAASWQVPLIGGLKADTGATNACPSHGALTAFDSATESETAYNGPLWVYTAPAGSKIAGGSLRVSLSAPHGQAYVATPEDSFTNAADVLVNCQYNELCGSTGFTGTVKISPPGGTQLFARAMCVGVKQGETACASYGSGSMNAEVSVYAADVELANESTPTGKDFSGPLLEVGASGTADLTFTATDPKGPGVYRVIADVDGGAVYEGTPDSNDGECASIGEYASGVREFLYAQPCKQEVAVDIPLDTTKFAAGSHSLKVTVEDVAGNSAVVLVRSVTFASHIVGSGTISIGPGSPLVVRGPANGTNASDQAKLTARWASTAKALRTSRYGVRERVAGHLTTSAGASISAASLDVYETPAYHGAGERRIGGVSTGPTGQWTLTLPRGVSSGVLRFDYRSHQNDTVAAASATLRLRVHAGIALKIAPRSASVGRKIFFSGVLHGVPIPEGGKQLVLEARSGGEWVQFNTIRTNAHGRYHSSYRFKFPGPITYRFRVLSRYEADFPFLDGTSNVVAVHEH